MTAIRQTEEMRVDFLGVAVGPPGVGKSTVAIEVNRRALAGRWLTFVHDEKHEFKANRAYVSAQAWLSAADAAAAKKLPFPRGASFLCDVEEVVDLAIRVGEHVGNRHDHVVQPILLALNEASSADNMTASYIPPVYKRALSKRRHYGIALWFNLQWATQLHPAVLATATDVYLFRQSGEVTPRLERQLHLGKGELSPLVGAPPFRFLHVRPGKGIVSAGASTPAGPAAAEARGLPAGRTADVSRGDLPAPPGAAGAVGVAPASARDGAAPAAPPR